jgi:hypothetical protein
MTIPQNKDCTPTADELAGIQWWNSMTEGRARQGPRGRRLAIGWRMEHRAPPMPGPCTKSAWVSRRSLMSDNTVRIDLELPPAEERLRSL